MWGCGFVPIKLYLCNWLSSWVWPMGPSLLNVLGHQKLADWSREMASLFLALSFCCQMSGAFTFCQLSQAFTKVFENILLATEMLYLKVFSHSPCCQQQRPLSLTKADFTRLSNHPGMFHGRAHLKSRVQTSPNVHFHSLWLFCLFSCFGFESKLPWRV